MIRNKQAAVLLYAIILMCSCASNAPVGHMQQREYGKNLTSEEITEVKEVVEHRNIPQEVTISGTVEIKKDPVLPETFIKTGSRRFFKLTGSGIDEISRLAGSGVIVKVNCQQISENECLVMDYEIERGPSGSVPIVGEIVEEGDRLYLETRVRLTGKAKKRLQKFCGARVYLEPQWNGGEIIDIKSYGVLKGEEK